MTAIALPRTVLTLLLLSVLAALLPVAPVRAAGSSEGMLYDVEMVVFRANPVPQSEDWSLAPVGRGFGSPPPHIDDAAELVRVLPSSDYRLDGIVRRLRTSGTWYPVAHAAWVQTAPAWGTHVGIPLASLGVNVPGLSGTVYLERAPIYLHLGFDVTLRGAAPYTIDEMRNVRANEKQYFDHPGFGIIAVVRPIRRADGG